MQPYQHTVGFAIIIIKLEMIKKAKAIMPFSGAGKPRPECKRPGDVEYKKREYFIQSQQFNNSPIDSTARAAAPGVPR